MLGESAAHPARIQNLYTESMSLPNINLNQGQTVQVTAVPEDANGNPGSLTPTVPTWKPGNANITITPAANGLSASVVAGTVPGVVQVDVSGQGIPFGPLFSSSFTVTVQQAPATQFAFTFGQPS